MLRSHQHALSDEVRKYSAVCRVRPWRTFLSGGTSPKRMYESLSRFGYSFGPKAEILLQHSSSEVPGVSEAMDVVVLTPSDLGHRNTPKTNELFHEERLREWGLEYSSMLDGRGIGPLPQSAVLPLCLECSSGPVGNGPLWIATDRVIGPDGSPHLFYLKRSANGLPHLNACVVGLNSPWSLEARIIFRLSRNPAAPRSVRVSS